MMQQPSGEPQMAQGVPPGGGFPPGGGGFSGGGSDGGFGGGPPPGGFGGGGPPPGGFGGGAPPGGGGYGGPPGGAPPGGYGGPPGGGGYGGPPQGGGPPPDGFGGAPPGGFGGPPQGGFGGPPQGGGFGGPPQGGGYGPPMGAPMGMQQPPPKKSNTGMIIGIGCAGIFILLCGVIGVGCWWTKKQAEKAAAAIASAFPIDSSGKLVGDPFDLKPPAADGSLKLDIRDVRTFKSGSLIMVVGEIENTGTAPTSYPSVKFTFYDATKTAIDSGTCTGTLPELAPGEKVPCSFILTKVKTWDNYKTESNPMKVYGSRKGAKLEISDTKFTPKKGYQPNKLEGKITNKSAFKAKHVTAVVGLYDKDKKICGTGFASVSGNELDSGTATTFSASIYETAAPPETYKVLAMGTGE